MPIRREMKLLSPCLEKRLASYTLAATAALASAGAPSLEGAVVYTSVKDIGEPTQIFRTVYAPIDLNHDGQIDFLIGDELIGFDGTLVAYRTATLFAEAKPGNQIAAVNYDATALAFNVGQEIGPNLKFTSGNSHAFHVAQVASVGAGPQSPLGYFYNQTNKFLALKLAVSGKIYYGWARLSVKGSDPANLTFELVDYAYQSTPNLPILAGQGIPKPELDSLNSASPAASAKQYPASLGMLAYGADALPLWRRR